MAKTLFELDNEELKKLLDIIIAYQNLLKTLVGFIFRLSLSFCIAQD